MAKEITIGCMIKDAQGRRGVVVGQDKQTPEVRFVHLEGIEYSRKDVGTPIHEDRLKVVKDARKKSSELTGQRIVMVKGNYEGVTGKLDGEPIMGEATDMPIVLDNGVTGNWPTDFWRLESQMAEDSGHLPPVERVDTYQSSARGSQVRHGILGERTAQPEEEGEEAVPGNFGEPVPQIEEAPGTPVVPEEPRPEMVPEPGMVEDANLRQLKDDAVVAIDKELRSMFGSGIVPQIDVMSLEQLPDSTAYALIVNFTDTSGKHAVQGTAIINPEEGIVKPPDKIYANGKEVGDFVDLPELFTELPEAETSLVQELDTVPAGPRAAKVLNRILEKHGIDAYRRAFERYQYKVGAYQKDQVHEMLTAGMDKILTSMLKKRGCVACGEYYPAGKNNYIPICGLCRKAVYDVSDEECEEACKEEDEE